MNIFSDVGENLDATDPFYPAKYVAVCAAHGITVGWKPELGLFGAYNSLTRAQLITMVARAADFEEPPLDADTWLGLEYLCNGSMLEVTRCVKGVTMRHPVWPSLSLRPTLLVICSIVVVAAMIGLSAPGMVRPAQAIVADVEYKWVVTNITNTPSVSEGPPCLCGRNLVYDTWGDGPGGETGDIYLYDLVTGETTNLTNTPQVSEWGPEVSATHAFWNVQLSAAGNDTTVEGIRLSDRYKYSVNTSFAEGWPSLGGDWVMWSTRRVVYRAIPTSSPGTSPRSSTTRGRTPVTTSCPALTGSAASGGDGTMTTTNSSWSILQQKAPRPGASQIPQVTTGLRISMAMVWCGCTGRVPMTGGRAQVTSCPTISLPGN